MIEEVTGECDCGDSKLHGCLDTDTGTVYLVDGKGILYGATETGEITQIRRTP